MPGFLLPIGNQFFDDNGALVPGGLLYSYAAGTLSPLAVYTDEALLIPYTNPAVLSAEGRLFAFMPDGVGYKFYLNDANDVNLWTVDNVEVPQILAPAAAAQVPTGGIIMYGGTVAPTGYLMCDGSSHSTATYPALSALLAPAFGGGGAAFNVPDLRQRFPLGKAVSGVGSTLGGVGGNIDHVHTGPSHTHPIASHTHTIAHTHSVPRDTWGSVVANPDLSGRLLVGDGGSFSRSQPTTDNTTGASSAANSGGTSAPGLVTDASGTADTGPANPPFQSVNFIIKT